MSPSAHKDRGFTVHALGEIAIRCRDFAAMRIFYRDMIGLRELQGSHAPGIVFFRMGVDHGGHVTVLALFAHDAGRPSLHPQAGPPIAGGQSSLHHVALTVDYHAQDAAARWLKQQGRDVRIEHFDWIGWRGVFTTDPDGNTVELVAKRPHAAATPHGDDM